MRVCSETFWCSNVNGEKDVPLPTLMAHFLKTACEFPLPVNGAPLATLSLVDSCVYARAVCRWNEHTYSCVCAVEDPPHETVRLHCVYDLGRDPEETENALPDLVHLQDDLLACVRAVLPMRLQGRRVASSVVAPNASSVVAPKVSSVVAPKASSVVAPPTLSTPLLPTPVLLPTSPTDSEASSRHSVRTTAHPAPRGESRTVRPPASVRARESRINTAHR